MHLKVLRNTSTMAATNFWFVEVVRRLGGYREITAIYGEKHKRSVQRILNKPALDASDESKLWQWHLEALSDWRKGKDAYETVEETAARVQLSPASGFVSAFFMNIGEQTKLGIPHTRRLAHDMDHLEQSLLQRINSGAPLAACKNVLRENPMIRRDMGLDPVNNRDRLPDFAAIESIGELLRYVCYINLQLRISLLALWDVEYCGDTFRDFMSIPLFLNLAHRYRARLVQSSGLYRVNTRKAEQIDTPMGQLIDLLWCLLFFARNGAWPQGFPTDGAMEHDLNLRPTDLAQLRAGRTRLNIARLHTLWPDDCRNTIGERMLPADTLLAVAHMWDLMYPYFGNRPVGWVDRLYMREWHRHEDNLRASQPRPIGPRRDWPAYLNRGLSVLA